MRLRPSPAPVEEAPKLVEPTWYADEVKRALAASPLVGHPMVEEHERAIVGIVKNYCGGSKSVGFCSECRGWKLFMENWVEPAQEALSILGNEGWKTTGVGLGAYETQVLLWAATEHEQNMVRYHALELLRECLKAGGCRAVTPAWVRWAHGKEKPEALARSRVLLIALDLGMKREVHGWCLEELKLEKLSEPCQSKLGSSLEAKDLPVFFGIVNAGLAGAKGLTSVGLEQMIGILGAGVHAGRLPAAPVREFLMKYWDLPEFDVQAHQFMFRPLVKTLTGLAGGKADLEALEKVAVAKLATLRKKHDNDEYRNIFEDHDEALEELRTAIAGAK